MIFCSYNTLMISVSSNRPYDKALGIWFGNNKVNYYLFMFYSETFNNVTNKLIEFIKFFGIKDIDSFR